MLKNFLLRKRDIREVGLPLAELHQCSSKIKFAELAYLTKTMLFIALSVRTDPVIYQFFFHFLIIE